MEGSQASQPNSMEDALTLALHATANQYQKVAFVGGALQRRTSSAVSQTQTERESLVCTGLRATLQIVHNNAANKVEAVDRQALLIIQALLSSGTYRLCPAVYHAAAKTVKAVTFKSAVALAAAGQSSVAAGLATAMAHCVDLLDFAHRRESSRVADVPGISSCDLCAGLPALEELAVTLTYLAGQADNCKEQAVGSGAVDSTKRAMAVLAAINGQGLWPPVSSAPADPVLAVAAGGSTPPAQVLPKLAFLLQVLS